MLIIKVRDELVLKQIDITDSIDLFNTIDRERNYLRQWLPFVDYTHSLQDSEDFIRSVASEETDGIDKVFVIHFQGEFAGLIGFKGTDVVNRKSELGYWLSEKQQKKGIMTDAVRALIGFGFGQLQLNRIQIKCAVENFPSKQIPLRLGFVLEGTERDGEILSDGFFVDLDVYSIIRRKDNWRAVGINS